MTHVEAETKQIREKLLGGTITKVITTKEGSFGFTVRNQGKTLDIWVDADPEGNGPGHLEIAEI